MGTIQIAIDAFAEHSDEVIHYEFTWTGNEKEARAVIKHVEGTTVGHGMKPGNLAHGTLRRLNEIPISATRRKTKGSAPLIRLQIGGNPSLGGHVLQRLRRARTLPSPSERNVTASPHVIARPLAGDDVCPSYVKKEIRFVSDLTVQRDAACSPARQLGARGTADR
jgi:hypothetical protein